MNKINDDIPSNPSYEELVSFVFGKVNHPRSSEIQTFLDTDEFMRNTVVGIRKKMEKNGIKDVDTFLQLDSQKATELWSRLENKFDFIDELDIEDWHEKLVRYAFNEMRSDEKVEIESIMNNPIVKTTLNGIKLDIKDIGAKNSAELNAYYNKQKDASLDEVQRRLKNIRAQELINQVFPNDSNLN